VCSNIGEAWRKRRYEAAFVSKLNDAEAEAAETQTWIRFAVECNYVAADVGSKKIGFGFSFIKVAIVFIASFDTFPSTTTKEAFSIAD